MHKLKFNFLFSFNWKERLPPKTHLPALLSPPTHFTYFKDSLWIKTHTFKVSQLLIYFEKIRKKSFLMRVGFLIGRTWKPYSQKLQLQYERLLLLLLLLEGNLLPGEELPPCLCLHKGILQDQGASKERGWSSTSCLVKQVWVMWEQKGHVGLWRLSAHTGKAGVCKGGEKVTGGFGEGSCGWATRHCHGLAGTALTSAFPLRYKRQALPSSILGTSKSEHWDSTAFRGIALSWRRLQACRAEIVVGSQLNNMWSEAATWR